jgi:ubiquinone/menaquinone biosynthesis C-methylase UbiE
MNIVRFTRLTVLAALLIATISLVASGAVAQHGHQRDQPRDIKEYLEHLERPERDAYQKPLQVVEALGLKPGMAVADLGSGSGYFTRRFVEAVTETGKVYAVDVEPEMLEYAKQSVEHMHVGFNAEFILARPDSPKLPFESVDLIFVCNTFHHLEDRSVYFANVKSSLKPGGRVAIVDFYHDERSGDLGFPKRHLVPRDTTIAEMTKAGYRLIKEHDFLSKQYFLEFAPSPEP